MRVREREPLEALLGRLRQGDKTAEHEFFRRIAVRFSTIAKQRVDEDDVEDVVQQACLTLLSRYRDGLAEGPFEATAYMVLRNTIGNYYQKRQVRRRVLVDGDGSETKKREGRMNHDPDLRRRLVDCLSKLIERMPRYARVLNLAHQGYTSDEIAQKMKIKPSHFYVLLSRSRHVLSECLQKGRLK